jgi:outer membrane immunogenic protein
MRRAICRLLAAGAGMVLLAGSAAAQGPGWSGPYAGFNVGYAGGDSQAREIDGPREFIADFQGATGGLFLGWQRQFQGIVAGVELEAGYLDLSSTVRRDVTGGFVTSGADLGAFAALSGRIGVVLGSSWLAYGRAGLVAAQMRGSTVQTCTAVDLCGGAQSTPVSSATTRDVSFGVLLGAGVEYKLTEHWNGRLEYQFMSLRKELALPAVDGPGWNNQVDVHALKLGLSYRF